MLNRKIKFYHKLLSYDNINVTFKFNNLKRYVIRKKNVNLQIS